MKVIASVEQMTLLCNAVVKANEEWKKNNPKPSSYDDPAIYVHSRYMGHDSKAKEWLDALSMHTRNEIAVDTKDIHLLEQALK